MSKILLEIISGGITSYTPTTYIEIDLKQHVHERFETFAYQKELNSKNIGIGYLDLESIKPKDILNIVDYSFLLKENSLIQKRSKRSFDSFTGKSYATGNDCNIFTHITQLNTYNKKVPLFFYHDIPEDTIDVQIEMITNIEKTEEEIYYFDSNDKKFYCNMQNVYNWDNGEYRYYILTITSKTETRRELLFPKPVCREAVWEDIDLTTGRLKENLRVFTKEKNTAGYSYYFNIADTYYVNSAYGQSLRGTIQENLSLDDSWYIDFAKVDIVANTNNKVRRYWLPEYDNQSFQPSAPYMYKTNINGILFNNRVVYTEQNISISTEEDRHVYIYVYDYDGSLIRLLTTNSNLDGQAYSNSNIIYEYGVIDSWDKHSILLNQDLLSAYTIEIEGFITSRSYTHTLDLNPLYNKAIRNYNIVYYLIPDVQSPYSAIQYLLLDNDNRIVYASQTHTPYYPNLQKQNTDGSFNSSTVIGKKYNSELDSDCFVKNWIINNDNDNAYLPLLYISFTFPNISSDIISVPFETIDRRISNLEKNPKILQSSYVYDEAGFPFHKNEIVVIELPLSLREEYGGSLSKETAESLAKKTLPVGVAGLVRWEWPKVKPYLVFNTDSNVTLKIPSPGLLYTARVYIKYAETSEWELAESFYSPATEIFEYDINLLDSEDFFVEVRLYDTIEFPAAYSFALRG